MVFLILGAVVTFGPHTGKADGRFVLSVPAPFSVTPSDGALKAGQATQISFGFQPDNAIPIESWYDDPQDRELDDLQPLLDRMRNARDVRPILVEAFGMRRRIEDADDSMLQGGWATS